MTTTSRRIPGRSLAAAAALAALALTLTGCSSGGRSDESSSGGDVAEAPAAAKGVAGAEDLAANDAGGGDTASVRSAAEKAPADTRSVISTGSVALRDKDVGRALFDVRKVVDRYAGEVEQERTETDDDGDARRSRLVVRIPAADFRDAMADLADVATLISSNSKTEDVTTEVIDNDVRVRVQRASIKRIELLLDRARSIRDIVSIESQLSSRQADLNSLEQRQSYLADQTSMSTITISLERTTTRTAPREEDDRTGFLPGLRAGWHGLATVAVGLLTVAGAVLPWAAAALLLAAPGVPLLRRLRRRAPVTPNPADA